MSYRIATVQVEKFRTQEQLPAKMQFRFYISSISFTRKKTLTKHARALLQVKGLYTKSACGKYLRKFTRTTSYSWPETNVSVQHTGRSPGLEIITSAAFPVSQWHIGFCSLITVTSSHRTFTCFPFHQNQYNDALSWHLNVTYSIDWSITLFSLLSSSMLWIFVAVICNGSSRRAPRGARHSFIVKPYK